AASKATATDTIALLEERLHRIDYALNGDAATYDTPVATIGNGSALARLRTLERTVSQLVARSPAAADAISLHKQHPSIFNTTAGAASPLPTTQLAALVLARASLYISTAAHLTQLQDTHIPDPAPLTKLVNLLSRLERARTRQHQQARELAELRQRSALAVEKWYEVGVLEMGENWADWEERVREVEILVRRREAAKRREEGAV
ncbi:hypothetical protein BAUCODRAFT_52590, partial [Baudoinia panamericana UAMH 10762]